MRRWLPSLWVDRILTTDPNDPSLPDAVGYGLSLRWLGVIFEIGVARIRP